MTAGKRKFVSAVLGVLAVACGASFALTGASAAEEPQTPSAESFALAGASVRLEETNPGLRFTSALSKAEYEALSAEYDIQAGMLIIPESELTGDLTLENETDEVMNVVTATYAPVDAEGNSVAEESAVNYQFRAVVSDIPEGEYGTEVLGRGYLSLTSKTAEDAEAFVLYTETLSRNVAYVAYKAKTNESWDPEQEAVLEEFIGERQFFAVSAADDAGADYDYAYAGQTVNVELGEDCFAFRAETESGNLQVGKSEFTMPAEAVTLKGVSASVTSADAALLDANRSAANGGVPSCDVSKNITVSEGELSAYAGLISYRSSNDAVATVNENGLVTAVGGGAAEIFVKLGDMAEQKIADVSVTAWTELTKENFIGCMTNVTQENGWCVVGNYYLSGDIDLEGAGALFGAPFNGILDGNGYAVKNAKFTGTAYGNQANGALFNDILEDAVVKNIAFVNFEHPNANQAGGFFNSNHGTIENVYVSRTGKPSSYGGLIGGKIPYWSGSAWAELHPTTGNYGTVKNVVIDTSGASNGPSGLIALSNCEGGVIENAYAVNDVYYDSISGSNKASPLYFTLDSATPPQQYGTSTNVNSYDDMSAIVAALPDGLLKTMVTRLISDQA